MVNLALWPYLVKQLGLGWGNALAGNLELLRPGRVNLRRERVLSSFGVGIACVALFSVIGVVAKSQQGMESQLGETSLIADYQAAPLVMLLPADALWRPSLEGFSRWQRRAA